MRRVFRIGLSPLIFETAVGLERLSPLGIVAGSSLLVGTFLTMIVVPVVYSSFDSIGNGIRKLGLWLNEPQVAEENKGRA